MSQNGNGSKSASGFLTLIMVGNLGRDPEMRYTPNGQPVTNFNLAVNQSVPIGNGEREIVTMWVRVSAWGKLAENCNRYLNKGSKVLVEADRFSIDPQTGSPKIYQRPDGTTGTSYEVTANRVLFLSAREVSDIPEGEDEEVINFNV
jgi:single-strand DNA-binding protein